MISFSFVLNYPAYQQAIGEGTGPVLRGVLGIVKERMRFSFRQTKTGKMARRRVPPRDLFRRSAPGQPPAIDSGVLDNSIQGYSFQPFKAELIINTPYAAYVNYGTARMAARPFAEPAVDFAVDQFNSKGVLANLGI